MKKSASVFLIFILFFSVTNLVTAQQTQIQYLSGTDKDHTVEWDFYCSKGRNSSIWSSIPVPSCWELHGFGNYNYGTDHDYGKTRSKSNEEGKYRHSFKIANAWKNKRILIVFEGSMTDTQVWINGRSAGPKHQGAFYRFKYDITNLVKIGTDNLLEVTVSKQSSNRTVNASERDADYWIFGGIFRPVYLQAFPAEFIDRIAINARADGAFNVDVYLKHLSTADTITGQILDLNGSMPGKEFAAKVGSDQNKVTLNSKVTNYKEWTAETPNLYEVKLALKKGKKTIHTVTERFGFRTIEVVPGEGIFVNGRRIRLKGVNRHSFRPESGRTLSRKDCYEDAHLIKQMNMNAVRMSHYPPDTYFLEACDELGLYVIDELASYSRSKPLDTTAGKKLIREMITRDINHPCILFWDNGNEGGWNFELDDEFALYDPQKRTVLHPYAQFKPPSPFNNVDTDHYQTYENIKKRLNGSTIYLTTEFLHGVYDGGHGAGLDDYWNLMRSSRLGAGGFLWDFADEGVVRTDKNGWIDTTGLQGADGILGPHMEKEGSFYTIAQVWSPIQIAMTELPKDFDGTIEIENQYDFINLSQCQLKWELVNFYRPEDTEIGHKVISKGMLRCPFANPGEKAAVKIPLPSKWKNNDALYLTAIDHTGRELWTWSWPLKVPGDYLEEIINKQQTRAGRITAVENDDVLEVSAEKLGVKFDKTTGKLLEVSKNGRKFSLNNGPFLVKVGAGLLDKFEATEMKIVSAKASDSQNSYGPENSFDNNRFTRWSVQGQGHWILYELNEPAVVDCVAVSWLYGNERNYSFSIEVSDNTENSWTKVFQGKSGGKSELLETYKFEPVKTRYLRVTCNGNTANNWNNIQELRIGKSRSALQVKEINYISLADKTPQPAMFYAPKSEKRVPLLVVLHTWSGDYTQKNIEYAKWCIDKDWAMIHPNFRGPNWTPDATGSDKVVKDILSAVDYAKANANVDTQRIYLAGGSGGGHASLLMAGRAPEVWAGVSAWVPITDLRQWYLECKKAGLDYAENIVKSCGGPPGESPAVDKEYRNRSPLTWLGNAKGVKLHINAGIYDGHKGSVPISHSLLAFNEVAHHKDRISPDDIRFFVEKAQVPPHLKKPITDSLYGENPPLFRRQSGWFG